MSAIKQRDKALSILDSKLAQLSKLYKECFLTMGRGAMLIYASRVIEGRFPGKYDYRKKEEILDVFDAPASHAELEEATYFLSENKTDLFLIRAGSVNVELTRSQKYC